MIRPRRAAYLTKSARLVQANSTKLLLASIISLIVFCIAIKSVKFDLELNSWIQFSARVRGELQYVDAALTPSTSLSFSNSKSPELSPSLRTETGCYSQLLIQTPIVRARQANEPNNVLNVDSFMWHLEAMAIATHITVDLYDVTWSLRELCYRPSLPESEGFYESTVLDRMLPCIIKTPLDCFWEGAKLHGPYDVGAGTGSNSPAASIQRMVIKKWTSLDPIETIRMIKRMHPNVSFDYDALLAWMQRVGMRHGYQRKPCLDPTDPNCPETAPNKFNKLNDDSYLASVLTGGCFGVAENQMHWREEELLGGLVKNKSGNIVRADALQSSIPLMGEQDMYNYWRRTDETREINNWSIDKAKHILESWQKRFNDELKQFTKTSISSNQKIHAMTSKSMLEPIDVSLLLDYRNFMLSFALMTLITCITFPSFEPPQARTSATNDLEDEINETMELNACRSYNNRLWLTFLALGVSLIVGLTFIASLGLSSLMDLSFNMATSQILPPLALFYGFNQLNTIVNIYSQKFSSVPVKNLTIECLTEIFPIIITELITYSIALFITSIIPIPATRIFASQAIIYIFTATSVVIVLVPAILTNFLLNAYSSIEDDNQSRPTSSCSFKRQKGFCHASCRRKSAKDNEKDDVEVDLIFSRIQDDLKNIQAGPRITIDTEGFRTSFNISTTLRDSSHSKQYRNHVSIDHNSKSNYGKEILMKPCQLPDLLLTNSNKLSTPEKSSNLDRLTNPVISAPTAMKPSQNLVITDRASGTDLKSDIETKMGELNIYRLYIKSVTSNRYIQWIICLLQISLIISLLPFASRVKYGLHLKDITTRGTEEYESFSVQEKYFPIYNIFAITKGNFDYPSNQRLLHNYYKALEKVEGVVKDDNVSRFWLVAFRDWLLDIQSKYDLERNASTTMPLESWWKEASDSAKLGYKLLTQTGRVDNPIDTSLAETNRLVDSSGIINTKAFYHYLTAWVSSDAFVYATTEADFKPEPKLMKDDPNNLKIEKARPLTFAQIPFLVKLAPDEDSVKTISEIRAVSQVFEQLHLPNFPSGIPFIFWDQFMNLDLLMMLATVIEIILIFIVMLIISRDANIAAINVLPIILNSIELYCLMGYLSIPFNNILAVLLISSIGISAFQTLLHTTVSIQAVKSPENRSLCRTNTNNPPYDQTSTSLTRMVTC